MAQGSLTVLDHWKVRKLRDSDLPLEIGVGSLESGPALIQAKRTGPVEWGIFFAESETPAVFSYAAVFASADNYQTGNLVSGNAPDQSILDSTKIQRHANHKCYYAFSFDTSRDDALYTYQKKLEGHMQTVPGFNPSGVERRIGGRGRERGVNYRFWMRTPMFLRVDEGQQKPACPGHLHEWVRQADKESRMYRANPNRPCIRSIEGGRLRDISQSMPNTLEYGDVVAITFMVSYVEGRFDWYPHYHLLDVIRVQHAPPVPPPPVPDVVAKTPMVAVRADLEDGEIVDEYVAAEVDAPSAVADVRLDDSSDTVLSVFKSGEPSSELRAADFDEYRETYGTDAHSGGGGVEGRSSEAVELEPVHTGSTEGWATDSSGLSDIAEEQSSSLDRSGHSSPIPVARSTASRVSRERPSVTRATKRRRREPRS
ncbi:hypothetical protein C8Q76DRAFT_794500 [Earliella scabrosa]|nr:hypothetical protein C8Q76DRAFT_794500 [Earliella scabrosa]